MGIATASVSPVSISLGVKQLSDDNSQGTALGQNPSDSIGFYTNVEAGTVPQPSGSGQAALTRGQAGASMCTFATTQSPSAVANITSGEKGMTVIGTTATWQVGTSDLLVVNKPTSQAGLGVGNVRVSAANSVGVTFTNWTAATITPTASQTYGIVALRGLPSLSATLSPAAVAPNVTAEQQFSVPGLRTGTKALVQVSKPTAQAGLDIVGCRSVSDGILGITFVNVTAATITPTASESYTIWECGGLDVASNLVEYQSLQSPVAVANATSAEQGLTVTGLGTTDTIVGVSKPTAQAGIGLVGWRVSAANTLGLTFMNATAATVTPTASEIYEVVAYRAAPVAPLVVYNQTLTPTSVAANTTAEQTFTVTGLVAGSPVWVNKPSWTNGLGVAGVRVSAANTLAITFANSTASAIVPPSEAYVIGNFQSPIPDAGGGVVATIDPASYSNTILTNSMRAALVPTTGVGLIAGA